MADELILSSWGSLDFKKTVEERKVSFSFQGQGVHQERSKCVTF